MSASFWIDPSVPREGFTALCAATLKQPIPLDMGESDLRVLQLRADMLAMAVALKQARQVGAIRRAVIVSRN